MTANIGPQIRLSRRAVLIGGIAGLVAAACGSNDSDGAGGGSNPAAGLAPVQIVPGFAYNAVDPGVLRPGIDQRAPLVLMTADGVPLEDGPDSIEVDLLDGDGQVVTTSMVAAHGDGVPSAYYPLTFRVEEPGRYTIATSVEGIDSRWDFVVAEQDKVALAQIGETLEPIPTPTASEPLDTEPICTRHDPCPFHERSHAELVANGRPTVLLVSTPAFCQTVICGPVLDLLIEQAEGRDDLDVVHAEVYKDAAETGQIIGATLTEAATVVPGALFEPSLVVTDGEGIVRARLDFMFDRTELAAALATVS